MLTQISGFKTEMITGLMILAGGGMVAGNLISGKMCTHFYPGKVAAGFQGLSAFALLLIFFLAPYNWVAVFLMCTVTFCLFAVSSPQQYLLIEFSPGGEMLGAASVQIAFNLGNAIGAYFGGLPIDYGMGVKYSALIGTGFCIIGFLIFCTFNYFYQPKKI